MHDPLRLCIALGPLAVYLLVLGSLNLGRRTMIVTGARDLAALGLGISGLMTVGPIELLLPQTAAMMYGPMIWLMLMILYSLVVSLASLMSKPRLVLYNACPRAEFRPMLAAAVDELDPQARWAGSTLALPGLQIEFVVDGHPSLRTITLTATHDRQNLAGWNALHGALARNLRKQPQGPNVWGFGLTTAALTMLGVIAWQLAGHPAEVVQSLSEMLRW